MIQRLIKYRALIATATVLVPLLFLFLHSELCSLTESKENHVSHDYCEIIKNITIQKANISDTNLLNLKIFTPFCYHCFEKQTAINSFLATFEHKDYYPQKTTKVYLHKKTFLI